MTTPLAPVQAAMYARLNGDALLAGRVFDHVPEGQPKPYVLLGEAIELPDNHHGGFGRETVETLHIWSDQLGYSEGTQMAARIVALLDHQPLTIAGHHHIATRYEFAQTLTDPARPGLRHVVLRFRIITEQE
ncbi:DUF3168 domain-containing protein [Thermomonospora cellulosilytica]|uniref:DUF3168 domain-containing protein n=1 Tax=Thermomonospora cellulosilytica TaxID=1411118 RepID=A0A7W3R767_9ACTN|nr:DUF3168 domain-containing protein [Thermomonospora cellulosilytica]MBA9002010.1 hypothetical protein [Thermomonospora cellulosilytica]